MARKSSREDKYIAQLKALGIYEPAFDPEIKTLATLEREWTAAKKEWSATAEDGGKPSFTDPLYSVIQNLRKEILAHREALGLTPKSLRKLRGVTDAPAEQDLIVDRLDRIAARVEAYDLPEPHSLDEAAAQAFAEGGLSLWDGLVPEVDTAAEEGPDCHASAAALARNDKNGDEQRAAF